MPTFRPRFSVSHCAAVMLALALGFAGSGLLPSPALAEAPKSRLSTLIRQKPTLYLPSRLLIGQENKFVAKGTPGRKAAVYLSAQSSGFTAPNGMALGVGQEHQKLEGVIPEKGVLVLTLPLPDQEALVGRTVHVEAVTWAAEGQTDMEVLELLDPTGHRAENNALAIDRPVSTKGAAFLPAIPGVNPNLLRQMSNISELSTADERKKELLDLEGTRNSDILLDQNTFFTRPDAGNLNP